MLLFRYSLARFDLEATAGNQDVQSDAHQAYRIATTRPVHGTVTQIRRIDHGNPAAANHFEIVTRANKGGCVLVKSDSDRKWVGRASGEFNTGAIFIAGKDTWHGFDPRPINGVRRLMEINYVRDDWRDREQLCHPDWPVKTS